MRKIEIISGSRAIGKTAYINKLIENELVLYINSNNLESPWLLSELTDKHIYIVLEVNDYNKLIKIIEYFNKEYLKVNKPMVGTSKIKTPTILIEFFKI